MRQAPAIWIVPHDAVLVAVPDAVRQAYQDHLQSLAALAQAEAPTRPEPLEPVAANTAGTAHGLAGSLCGFCAGRCCRWGADRSAFISADSFRRWMAAHPGGTPDDAAAAYLAHVPASHVEGSCVHHGAAGCTLPSAMRSDICHSYACDGLRALRQLAPADPAGPAPAVVAAMGGNYTFDAVALLTPDRIRRLPKPLPPKTV